MYASAKTGSQPYASQPATVAMVPVGATVVWAALRMTVLLDALHDLIPIDRGTTPIVLIRRQGLRRRPLEILGIVQAAFDRGERTAIFRQLQGGLHAVEAHELHHLRGKFLRRLTAIADAEVIHQVAQSHDAQADAPRAMGRFLQLRHRRHILDSP